MWLKIALNAVKLPKFEALKRKSWSLRTIMIRYLPFRSRLRWFCASADDYVVFKTVPYTILADNSIYLNCRAIWVV